MLNAITDLLGQLGELRIHYCLHSLRVSWERFSVPILCSDHAGNIDKVDLSKLDQIDRSLKEAKEKMAGSDLDRKLKELNDMAKGQEDMISDYDRQIREIRADIANLNDIKNTLPNGCFNTPSLERP